MATEEHTASRGCYTRGCRRVECTEAQRLYNGRWNRMKAYGWATTNLIDASCARAHLVQLQALGVGRRTVALRTGLGTSTIVGIRNGTATRTHPNTEKRILAVTDEPGQAQKVDAYETWRLINLLLKSTGWTKTRLAQELGVGRSIQLRTELVTVKNAQRVRALAEEWLSDDEMENEVVDEDIVDEVAVDRAVARIVWDGHGWGLTGKPIKLTRSERVEAVRRLTAKGVQKSLIGKALGIGGSAIASYLAEVAQLKEEK